MTIDFLAREVHVDGVAVALQPREFNLLAALARNLGHAMTRPVLLAIAWPDAGACVESERTVDVHVRRLRQKLGVAGSLIETMHTLGYKLRRLPTKTTA